MTNTYLPRLIDRQLAKLFAALPAISIAGARGVGKTATAAKWAKTVVQFDNPDHLNSLRAQPNFLAQAPAPILIDEWQLYPPVWDQVRREVDRDRTGGRFLLTGSIAPKPGATAHTGAGRIIDLRMRPMTLEERQLGKPLVSLSDLIIGQCDPSGSVDFTAPDYAEQIICSGFPDIFGQPPRAWKTELDAYIQRAVDVELSEGEYRVRNLAALRAWLRAYAACVGKDANYNEILDLTAPSGGNKPTIKTANSYRDKLLKLWLLDPLPAWNFLTAAVSRRKKGPVHHLADPALAARLLQLDVDDLLLPDNGAQFNQLFKSLATLCVRSLCEHAGWKISHLRTRNGDHEVDLVVQASATKIVGIAVKLASDITDNDVKHLHWFRQNLGAACRDVAVIYTGKTAYRRPDGVAVIPLAGLVA